MAPRRLEEGRAAVASRAWREAHEALLEAWRDGPLAAVDLQGLALASYLIGEEEHFLDALRDAHQAFLDEGDALAAVRAAFWLGQHLTSRGELARASGWFGRAARVVEDRETEGAARGYVLLPAAHGQLMKGAYEECAETSARAADIGRRCRDEELAAIATHVQGRALLRLGRLEDGLALLDEAMTSVAADALSPIASGLIYCSVISACRDVWALQRAQEWTSALTEWCARQPDMVAYTGPCRVSRAEILTRRGAWSEAIDEARLAVDRFEAGSGPGSAGSALYQQGEVHRLRGEYAAAEEAYRAASAAGRQPQPGLARLRLAQGRADSAVASLRRALSETKEPLNRAKLLPAYVDLLVETGATEAATEACDELRSIADAWGGAVLETFAAQARGTSLLAEGDAERALPLLRRAYHTWEAHDAPYEAARVRALIGAACHELGDDEGAALEAQAARATFEELGAGPDVERLGGGPSPAARAADHGLTPRELEVLEWLATGRTNRAIADALSISEKTVARHVSNIFSKLGLSSRAAATAYAYEHDLAGSST